MNCPRSLFWLCDCKLELASLRLEDLASVSSTIRPLLPFDLGRLIRIRIFSLAESSFQCMGYLMMQIEEKNYHSSNK